MFYYKVSIGNAIIDANTVFLKWQERNKILLVCDSTEAQYAQSSDGSKLWTDTWMIKKPTSAPVAESVSIELIDEEEYNSILSKLNDGETITVPEDTPSSSESDSENDSISEENTEPETKKVMSIEEMRIAVAKLSGNVDEDSMTLDELKDYRIQLSKEKLSEYLAKNPLISSCHNGREAAYTATLEKQSLFATKYMAHVSKQSAGIPDVMTWNAAGETCEVWTDSECIQFIVEMDAYVTPLVAKQQEIEIKIKEALTADAVKAIEIPYGE